ncbi:type II secretion system protein [Rhizobacter sp. AJA081-3]|nr:type II secretion system protein [Rhizobacter sp. AJA081-3]
MGRIVSGRSRARSRGFSLVELLVVVAIMSVLASIGMPLAELSNRRGKEEELRRSLREIRTAIDSYKRMVDSGRIARDVGASGYPPNLDVLVDGAVDAQSPRQTKIFFLRKLPRDPFAPESITQAAESWGLRSYESPPTDPRPGKDVFDVYSKAEGSGLDGLPYRKW